MSDWPDDMRTINVKTLAKIVRGLESKIGSIEQGSPPAAPSPTFPTSPAEGALTFEQWAPDALTALITAHGYDVAGSGSIPDTVANLGAAWMGIMGIRGHSDEEIFAFWDEILATKKRLEGWRAELRARNLRERAKKRGVPVEALMPPEPQVFQGDRGAMDNVVTPAELAAEDAVTETVV